MKKILAIIGARPQFIKHAPIELALKEKVHLVTIHTGQHYDENMSTIFFDQLKMQKPDFFLNIGSFNHGIQTGMMMEQLEPIVESEKPDAILVYGDTNSTLAGALVGSKLNIPIIHLEAGLRSFNKKMPEEINRIVTDHVSSMLLVPTKQAIENLNKEGITQNVFLTGDVMCDMVKIAENVTESIPATIDAPFYYATIHRPYNTDEAQRLKAVLEAMNSLDYLVYFVIHPRTLHKMAAFGLEPKTFQNIKFISPVSYFENIQLQQRAKAVITDSGGIQKEAYVLKKKCVTIRTETEWTETLVGGWNILAYDQLPVLQKILDLEPELDKYDPFKYGDGNAAKEIAAIIENNLF